MTSRALWRCGCLSPGFAEYACGALFSSHIGAAFHDAVLGRITTMPSGG